MSDFTIVYKHLIWIRFDFGLNENCFQILRQMSQKTVHKNWSYVCDHIFGRLLSDPSFVSRFETLSTNAEKVKHCLSEQFVRQLLDQFLTINGSAKHQKYWEKAKEFRIDGNECFKKKYFVDAINAYNQVLNNCLVFQILITIICWLKGDNICIDSGLESTKWSQQWVVS